MKLTAAHEHRLGAYLIALFLDAGLLRGWPLEWTEEGIRARKETFRG